MKSGKIRVCAYARVSTMTEKQQDSLTNQQAYYSHLYQNKKDVDLIRGFRENWPNVQAFSRCWRIAWPERLM